MKEIWTSPEDNNEEPQLICRYEYDDDGVNVYMPDGRLLYSADWHTHILTCFMGNYP